MQDATMVTMTLKLDPERVREWRAMLVGCELDSPLDLVLNAVALFEVAFKLAEEGFELEAEHPQRHERRRIRLRVLEPLQAHAAAGPTKPELRLVPPHDE